MADAPPIAMVFRNSLRSLIFEVFKLFSVRTCKYNNFSCIVLLIFLKKRNFLLNVFVYS